MKICQESRVNRFHEKYHGAVIMSTVHVKIYFEIFFIFHFSKKSISVSAEKTNFSVKSSFFFLLHKFYSFRYVGDGRDSDNEILENIRPRTTEGKDDRGSYVTQEINWGPTREELCNYRDLVSHIKYGTPQSF